MNKNVIKQMVVGIAALVLMIMVTACAGVGTSSSNGLSNLTISGSVVSVDPVNHSVTLNVNGQTKTIGNVPDNVLMNLQNQIGKFYSIQVTQNPDGTYSIKSGTNDTSGENTTGSINFIGVVQSANSNNIVVKMPDGSNLNLAVSGQTDLSKLNGSLPSTGQIVKISASVNNGVITASEVTIADNGDLLNQNTVTFQGFTIQAVGSDRVIHFSVGNMNFSFPIASTAELKDFNGNAQAIATATSVKVVVQFNGNSGEAIDINLNSH